MGIGARAVTASPSSSALSWPVELADFAARSLGPCTLVAELSWPYEGSEVYCIRDARGVDHILKRLINDRFYGILLISMQRPVNPTVLVRGLRGPATPPRDPRRAIRVRGESRGRVTVIHGRSVGDSRTRAIRLLPVGAGVSRLAVRGYGPGRGSPCLGLGSERNVGVG